MLYRLSYTHRRDKNEFSTIDGIANSMRSARQKILVRKETIPRALFRVISAIPISKMFQKLMQKIETIYAGTEVGITDGSLHYANLANVTSGCCKTEILRKPDSIPELQRFEARLF